MTTARRWYSEQTRAGPRVWELQGFPSPLLAAEQAVIARSRKPSLVIERSRRINNLKLRSEYNMNYLRNFWMDDQGQDLIEYTLLLAFVALASAALFISAGGSIKTIWGITNNQLSSAATSASS